jgi:Cytochrome C biogenesis protein
MQQQPVITSGSLSTTPHAPRAATQVRRLWSLLATLTMLMLSMAAGDTTDARYKALGHRMICMCAGEPVSGMGQRGCKQILLECTHANCDVSPRMTHELKVALQKGDSDDVIMKSFVQNYGTEVLEQSRTASNNLIWVVALAVLTCVVIAFARKWKSRPALVAAPTEQHGGDVDAFRERVRREVENDDWH